MALVMRDEMRSYMDVSPSDTTPTYELIGDGFTDATTSLNPNTYDRQYIHERTGQSDVVSYAPSMAYTADMDTEDPVLAFIWDVGNKRKIGSEATTTIVTVMMWEKGTATDTYKAYLQKIAIVPDNPGSGAAGTPLALSGNFKYKGYAVEGSWNESNKTFTPDEA